MNMNNNFEPEPQHPFGTAESPEADKTASVKKYNPYTDEPSLFREVYEENKSAFLGPEPLQFESHEMFRIRLQRERTVAKRAASVKLKKVSGYVSLFLLLFLVIREGLSTPLGLISGSVPDKVFTVLTDVFLVLQYVAVAAVVIYVMTLGRKNTPRTYFAKSEVSAGFTLRWTVIAFGIVHLVAIVFNIIFTVIEELGVHINDLSSPLPTGIAENVLYFVAVVICAPIFEELIFRGLLLTPLSKFGDWFAIITTAVLFGLFHMNHAQFFFATAFGIILGFVDVRARSIVPSIISHAVFNGYSFVLGFVASFTNYEEYILDPETVTLTGSPIALGIYGFLEAFAYAMMLAAIVLLIIELVKNKEQFSLRKGGCGLTAKDKFSAFLSHPLTVTYLIIIFFYIVLISFVDMEGIMETVNEMMELYKENLP